MAFVREGEGVIVQPPVYFPFFSAVTTDHRILIENPLRPRAVVPHRLDDLEQCAADGAGSCCSVRRTIRWGACGARRNSRIVQYCAPLRHHHPCRRNTRRPRLPRRTPHPARHAGRRKRQDHHHCRPEQNLQHPRPRTILRHRAERRACKAIQKTFEILHVQHQPVEHRRLQATSRRRSRLDSLLVYLQGNRDFVHDYVAQHACHQESSRRKAPTCCGWIAADLG